MSIRENQIVVSALLAMVNAGGFIQTSDLIDVISKEFTLDENDQQILINRNDEKFTQIVRNLKSHDRLTKFGLAEDVDGGFKITPKGIDWLIEGGFLPNDH